MDVLFIMYNAISCIANYFGYFQCMIIIDNMNNILAYTLKSLDCRIKEYTIINIIKSNINSLSCKF